MIDQNMDINAVNAAPLPHPVKTVKQIPQYYKNWVVSDPEQTSRLETIVRILGYAVPGESLALTGRKISLLWLP